MARKIIGGFACIIGIAVFLVLAMEIFTVFGCAFNQAAGISQCVPIRNSNEL